MKRLTLLLTLLTLVLGLGARTVTVGRTTDTLTHMPIDASFNYSYSQQIYDKNRIDHSGEISKIRFYHHYTGGNLDYSHNWMIYMGHAARYAFNSTSDWEPISNLTHVFTGSILDSFAAESGWVEITLQTPFAYNNANNLLVAICENSPGHSQTIHWGNHQRSYNNGIYYHGNGSSPNPASPPNATSTTDTVPAIQIVFTDNRGPYRPHLYRPYNNEEVMNGYLLEWSLSTTSADATGYDVYIDGVMVSQNQPKDTYKLSGLEAGTHTWYVIARNQFGDSLASDSSNFIVCPGAEIGSDNALNGLPIKPSCNHNYSQTIYLKSEIDDTSYQGDAGYSIDKISYYWSGAGRPRNSRHWTVYMGHTDKTSFAHTSDWIPTSQMVQVFSGEIDTSERPHWKGILLDTPFLYDATDNLVIAVHEHTPDHDANHVYFHSTNCSQNRSLQKLSSYDIDPNSLPVGSLKTAYPNILIWTGELLTTPVMSVAPTALDYGVVISSDPVTLNMTVKNKGVGHINLAESDISIVGPNADQFSFDPANLPIALDFWTDLVVPVTLTGTTSGQISATLRIVYQGENYDVELAAMVTLGHNTIIGDGTSAQAYPFETEYEYSSSATLYKADEINSIGTLQMIGWDCHGVSDDLPVRYKIWAKNTTDTCIRNSTWNNMFSQMTLLKQGTITFAEPGWQKLVLDTLFVYTGQNLIIAVQTNVVYDGWSRYSFKCTDVVESRHLYHCGYDGPPTDSGQVNGLMPNIMLQFAYDWENDIGATRISGDPIPIVGVASNYNVRIRNNGSNVQADYQVKLMGSEGAELAVVNGPPINSGETIEVEIPWIPTVEGAFNVYGKVELAGDEVLTNNQTTAIMINVQPEGRQTIDIGSGDELARYPLDLLASDYLYETIYTADELGIASGTIYSMVIYNQFMYQASGRRAVIYMGTTDQQDLSTGFIPATQLTPVYDGLLNFPQGENAILINLRVPFVYTGGNLVVMFHRPVGESSVWYGQYYFKCQTGSNRGRHAHLSNITQPVDPNNPPEGTLVSTYPKATFFFTAELLANDLYALYLRGAESATAGVAQDYTVRIRNNGVVVQDNYQVKLMRSDETELAAVAGPPIGSLQSLNVAIPWIPTALGSYTIYGKVELNGDEIPINNSAEALGVMVYPLGVEEMTATLDDAGEVVEIAWAAQTPAADPEDLDMPTFIGYKVYRLLFIQRYQEDTWVSLTDEPITELSYIDPVWLGLPSGNYCWAVKAVYTGDRVSLPGFSNFLSRSVPCGTLTGKVYRANTYMGVSGATISNGMINAITDTYGRYSFTLPAGTYTMTASAPGHQNHVVTDVVIVPDGNTDLNFYLPLNTPVDDPQIPVAATALNGNYPNPFNPETTINYSVKEAGRVRLIIYNVKGQLVRTLLNEDHATGHYRKVFDGRDDAGCPLASGVYLVRMIAPGYQKSSKMMLMK